jgi:hypothetical protein
MFAGLETLDQRRSNAATHSATFNNAAIEAHNCGYRGVAQDNVRLAERYAAEFLALYIAQHKTNVFGGDPEVGAHNIARLHQAFPCSATIMSKKQLEAHIQGDTLPDELKDRVEEALQYFDAIELRGVPDLARYLIMIGHTHGKQFMLGAWGDAENLTWEDVDALNRSRTEPVTFGGALQFGSIAGAVLALAAAVLVYAAGAGVLPPVTEAFLDGFAKYCTMMLHGALDQLQTLFSAATASVLMLGAIALTAFLALLGAGYGIDGVRRRIAHARANNARTSVVQERPHLKPLLPA